jgi:hypothetical protein
MPIEQMIRELLEADWSKMRIDVWRAPWGSLYRGPAGAWKVMRSLNDCAVPARGSKTGGCELKAPWLPKIAKH